MKKEAGVEVTIDELAKMMNRSFEHLENKIDGVESSLRAEMREGFARVDDRFSEVNTRMDIMDEYKDLPEGKRFNNHENRISRLEDNMRVVKTALGK